MLILDKLILTLTLLIALLLATGGVHYASPTLKLELSEVNVFAWIIFVLLCFRRWKWKRWLPPQIERRFSAALIETAHRPLAILTAAITTYVVLQTWNSIWRF